jgi:hypothetical protein
VCVTAAGTGLGAPVWRSSRTGIQQHLVGQQPHCHELGPAFWASCASAGAVYCHRLCLLQGDHPPAGLGLCRPTG